MSKSIQHPQKAPTAAQRANEANRAQQIAVNGTGGRPTDRKATQEGEISNQGLTNDQRPAGLARKD